MANVDHQAAGLACCWSCPRRRAWEGLFAPCQRCAPEAKLSDVVVSPLLDVQVSFLRFILLQQLGVI